VLSQLADKKNHIRSLQVHPQAGESKILAYLCVDVVALRGVSIPHCLKKLPQESLETSLKLYLGREIIVELNNIHTRFRSNESKACFSFSEEWVSPSSSVEDSLFLFFSSHLSLLRKLVRVR
jgi:hypothetical protein